MIMCEVQPKFKSTLALLYHHLVILGHMFCGMSTASNLALSESITAISEKWRGGAFEKCLHACRISEVYTH